MSVQGQSGKCQFCDNAATVLIRSSQKKPTLWLCDEHALHLAKGLVEDITSIEKSRDVIDWLSKQEKKEEKIKRLEKQALHVSYG